MPFVSGEIVHVVVPAALVQNPATEPPDAAVQACAVYPVIAEPPSDDGAAQLTWNAASAPVIETLVGAEGAAFEVLPDVRDESDPVIVEMVTLTAIQ